MAHLSESNSLASQSGTSSVDMGKGHQSPLTFGLLLCGGVGAVLFTAIYLLEGIARPGYAAWQQPISALSLGAGGWVQQANFIVFGVLLLLSAVGWYRYLTPGRGAIWFSLFQGIAGLALIGAGVFSMDPFPGYPPGAAPTTSTAHGMLHTICAYTIIIALVLSCFTLASRFWSGAHWRGWAVYSSMSGVLMLILWEAFVQYPTGPVAGLVERLSAGSHDLWMCAVLVMLSFQHRRQRISRRKTEPAYRGPPRPACKEAGNAPPVVGRDLWAARSGQDSRRATHLASLVVAHPNLDAEESDRERLTPFDRATGKD